GSVHEVMPVRSAGLKAGGGAGRKQGLALVLDQHQLAFKYVDELILPLVPMPQRRGGAGLERGEIDAELVEAGGVAEPLALAPQDHAVVRRRVTGPAIDGKTADVDLGHATLRMTAPLDQARRQAAAGSPKYPNATAPAREINRPFTVTRKDCSRG